MRTYTSAEGVVHHFHRPENPKLCGVTKPLGRDGNAWICLYERPCPEHDDRVGVAK